MKFSNFINIAVGSEGEIILKEPSARELNNFHRDAYGKGAKDDITARVTFFDYLFVKITGAKDDEGDIPEDGKARIPDRVKNAVVLKYIESLEAVDPKNF